MEEETKEKKHAHISRIDQETKRTHGWYARVRHNGVFHSKLFSDLTHGGRGASLAAALDWRDATEKALGRPRTDRHVVMVSRTNTGFVGVSHVEKDNRFHVTWVTVDGRQGKTTVSVRKYGKEEAFRRACEIRATKEAERIGGKSNG